MLRKESGDQNLTDAVKLLQEAVDKLSENPKHHEKAKDLLQDLQNHKDGLAKKQQEEELCDFIKSLQTISDCLEANKSQEEDTQMIVDFREKLKKLLKAYNKNLPLNQQDDTFKELNTEIVSSALSFQRCASYTKDGKGTLIASLVLIAGGIASTIVGLLFPPFSGFVIVGAIMLSGGLGTLAAGLILWACRDSRYHAPSTFMKQIDQVVNTYNKAQHLTLFTQPKALQQTEQSRLSPTPATI